LGRGRALIAAERLDVSVEWAPLLRGEIRLDRAEFVAPQITLVRAADGRVSWDFAGDTRRACSASSNDGGDRRHRVRSVPRRLRPRRDQQRCLRWIDQATPGTITVTDSTPCFPFPPARPSATLEASAEVDGRPLEATIFRGCVAPLLEGQVRPTSAALSWSGGQAAFDGRLSLTPALDGTFTLEATDLGPLLALAGAAMPELPSGRRARPDGGGWPRSR
jgi:AsmA protein